MKNNRAFTLIELITGAVILAIAVAGVYASFVGAAKFVGFFRHDIQAVISAQSYLEQVHAENKFRSPTGNPNEIIDRIDDDPAGAVDETTWPLNNEVNNLTVTPSVTGNVGLGTTAPDLLFKRVDVTVSWDERQI